ncbi:MAG: response regulator [Candidatus Saccharimonadales bacterium]
MTKIMLVEDDKSLREIYGIRLIAEGYEIKSAGDGEEALAMIIKERPDLVISDVMMPKISGFDMLDILRATPETKDIKVIMMTALSSEDQRSRGQALGADRYLVKSQVGIEDVVRTVHDVLGDAPNSTKPVAPAFSSPFNTPTAAKPAPQPVAVSQTSNEMPRPTAPFSSSGPASLGDNMIKPTSMADIAPAPAATPAPMPMPTPAPAPMPAAEVAPMQPAPQPVAPTPIQVTMAPETVAPMPEPIVAPTPEPMPEISQAPAPAPTYNPTPAPVQPTAAPIQDVSPAPQQMAQPTPVDIADLIAKELGNHETPATPAQPQA